MSKKLRLVSYADPICDLLHGQFVIEEDSLMVHQKSTVFSILLGVLTTFNLSSYFLSVISYTMRWKLRIIWNFWSNFPSLFTKPDLFNPNFRPC